MIPLYISRYSAENERAYGTTHFNNGGPMDTGYPAFIPEPLHNPNVKKPSSVSSPLDSQKPQGRLLQPKPTDSPPTIKKVS